MRISKKKYRNSALVAGTLLILILAFSAYFFPNGSILSPFFQESENKKKSHAQVAAEQHEVKGLVTVAWDLLQTMDYQNFEIPSDLKKVLHSRVRIPGFAVPLSDGLSNIDEFLLVPNPMACIHVPAPPPNLVVLVELEKGVSMAELVGPLWVEGVLEVKKSESVYGEAAFEMKAKSIKPYSAPS